MGEKLPVVTARAVTRVLLHLGFTELRQRGSHRVFARGKARAIVPMHGDSLKPGTLKAILESAGLSVDELRKAL